MAWRLIWNIKQTVAADPCWPQCPISYLHTLCPWYWALSPIYYPYIISIFIITFFIRSRYKLRILALISGENEEKNCPTFGYSIIVLLIDLIFRLTVQITTPMMAHIFKKKKLNFSVPPPSCACVITSLYTYICLMKSYMNESVSRIFFSILS